MTKKNHSCCLDLNWFLFWCNYYASLLYFQKWHKCKNVSIKTSCAVVCGGFPSLDAFGRSSWAGQCGGPSSVAVQMNICLAWASEVNVICKYSKCIRTLGGTAVNEKWAAGALYETNLLCPQKVPIRRLHWMVHLHVGTLKCQRKAISFSGHVEQDSM